MRDTLQGRACGLTRALKALDEWFKVLPYDPLDPRPGMEKPNSWMHRQNAEEARRDGLPEMIDHYQALAVRCAWYEHKAAEELRQLGFYCR